MLRDAEDGRHLYKAKHGGAMRAVESRAMKRIESCCRLKACVTHQMPPPASSTPSQVAVSPG
eukprot:4028524-Pyramimonas_sp.AAC.1